MPDITFRRTDAPSEVAFARAPGGGRLLDACDEARAPVSFSCRSATCGTCVVRVLEGAAHLEPAGPEERELLCSLGLVATHRLACRASIRPGAGQILLACGPPQPGA